MCNNSPAVVIESILEVSCRIHTTVCKLCVGVVFLSRSGHSFSQIDANENRDVKFDLTSNGIRLSCNQQVVNCGISKIHIHMYIYMYISIKIYRYIYIQAFLGHTYRM